MPIQVEVTTESARFGVEGGRRIKRLLKAQGDEKLKARILADILRRELLPTLRQQVPRRTGKLRRSLRIVQRGEAVELHATFYGRLVSWNNGQMTVPEASNQIFTRNQLRFLRELSRRVARSAGV